MVAAHEGRLPLAGAGQNGSVPPGPLIGAVFSTSSDAVIVIDDAGAIVLASPSVTRLFGYIPEELIGEPIELLVPTARRPGHAAHRAAFLDAGAARRMGSGIQLYGLRRDGRQVPIEVSLNPTAAAGRHYVAAFVRDATPRLRALRQVEAVNEVTSGLLGGASVEATLDIVTRRARELLDAAAAWVVTARSPGSLVISSADGRGAEALVGYEVSATASRSAAVIASGEMDLVDALSAAADTPEPARRLGLGPGAFVPLAHAGQSHGVLVVARPAGSGRFDPFEVDLVSLFANAASVALVVGAARREGERMRLIEEDERIARDLHDTVIQRAFAAALSLAAVRQLTSGAAAERTDQTALLLDDMVRDLRNAVFRLGHLGTGSPRG